MLCSVELSVKMFYNLGVSLLNLKEECCKQDDWISLTYRRQTINFRIRGLLASPTLTIRYPQMV